MVLDRNHRDHVGLVDQEVRIHRHHHQVEFLDRAHTVETLEAAYLVQTIIIQVELLDRAQTEETLVAVYLVQTIIIPPVCLIQPKKVRMVVLHGAHTATHMLMNIIPAAVAVVVLEAIIQLKIMAGNYLKLRFTRKPMQTHIKLHRIRNHFKL